MTGYGAGIRRGPMAADRFTQIRNELFRDRNISFKAKGIFGLISTHRDGWRVSVAELARLGPDGKDSVTSGLRELERYGYLIRSRERRDDGTLAEVAYYITDMPEPEHPHPAPEPNEARKGRSQPVAGNPPLADPAQAQPAQANPHTKKTKRKKTIEQNTTPLPPSASASRTKPEGDGTEGTIPPQPTKTALTPGEQLLLSLAADRPELLITGRALRDQGAIATEMLRAGWTADQLRHLIADRPLPHPIKTSTAAIISARLRTAHSLPAPTMWQEPAPAASPRPEARTLAQALAHRALTECAGCAAPGTAPGEDLCPDCLGWPHCHTCTGPTPRRASPDGDGSCSVCRTRAAHQEGRSR